MMMQELLYNAVEQKNLRSLDMQFAMMVAGNDEPAVMLAAAILSRDAGKGHVCLPLTRLFEDNKTSAQLHACFELLGTVDWPKTLMRSGAVSDGNSPTPLVLNSGQLYLNRMWHDELAIARFFSEANEQTLPYNKAQLSCILNELFGITESVNWQKVAAAVALTRRISIITGGPGTGKTTTVAKLLIALIKIAGEKKCRIKLSAPTGKAAMRLTESLSRELQNLLLAETQRKSFPSDVSTLHRLLGAQSGSRRLRYHADNPLHLDVLVVDEASMLDLNMMSRLIYALPPYARVIFLGDRDQLASVEAGAVLSDICTYASKGYTTARAHELTQLTGCLIKGNPNLVTGKLHDSFCLLQTSYRFSSNSGIGQLASAVKQGNQQSIKRLFNVGTFGDIRKMVLKTSEDYLRMLEDALEGYLCFLRCIRQQTNPEIAITMFSQFQLLCALREGPFGVTGLNERLEQLLFKTRNVNHHQLYSNWYEGRPVIISRNDSNLGLFNGDIGIALEDHRERHGLRVWFQMQNGSVKSVLPSRLPEHETAWAITVHKSQGSEFDHVMLVLPIQTTPVVTRELVYTAITRARKRLSIYSDDLVFMQAIATRTERRSGLNFIFDSI